MIEPNSRSPPMAKKAKRRATLDPSLPIFQFKVTLQHIDPPIWRRVLTNDCSLDELHDIIQVCMGWEDEHMYAFVIEGEQYTDIDGADPYEYHDSRSVRISDLVEQASVRFRYDYDFGDDWKHIVEIEKTLQPVEGVRYPCCVKGERACPPEDCGGPYGYPYLLDKIQDPEHEEHDETLEWVGEEFDSEEFDLEEVNEELHHLRRWLGNRRGKHALQAVFAKGDFVRVKPGIVHERYPDIPLGGWVGKIKRIGWLTPIGYAVHWTKPTLDQAHAVYVKRCQRDDVKPYKYWLEEDQLEAAVDETPTAMEQPMNIVIRPLSMEEPDDRIRTVFGLTSDDGLPKADEQMQRHYFDYLKAHLSYPVKAEYWPATA
ncbi:MAG: plasmid pRiA4b ORF-3 family protein, partial [Candidatus Nealsonbacteria bacterium]|nr:plasmid pRiA4b ORF-3 family protein [Candidatus Nealsonbacteria bacterium]